MDRDQISKRLRSIASTDDARRFGHDAFLIEAATIVEAGPVNNAKLLHWLHAVSTTSTDAHTREGAQTWIKELSR